MHMYIKTKQNLVERTNQLLKFSVANKAEQKTEAVSLKNLSSLVLVEFGRERERENCFSSSRESVSIEI